MSPHVLHVVESMNRGAVENWLERMFLHGRARGVALDWTFYCAHGQPGVLDARLREAGAHVVYSPVPLGQPLAFARALRREIARGGYDVLHAHHDLVSALYLSATAGLPVRRRLVHVHNADETVPTVGWKRGLLRPALRWTALRLADRIVGISQHTLDTFLAGRPRRPGRDHVHYYGVDPAPFARATADRAAFRSGLGLATDARLLVFGGRLVPEKNPVFAVDVLAEMARRDDRVAGVFVGDGPLATDIVARAEALGVAERVRLLGWRDGLPAILVCGDWFILPRPETPMEGLGLAVVEAQLAGLRLVLSCGISDDTLLPGASVVRLSLAAGARAWAEAALALPPAPGRTAAAAALAASPFDLDTALEDLVRLHA